MKDIKTLVNMLKQINYILQEEEKKKAVAVFGVTLISAILELLGVAVLLPFIQLLLNPSQLKGSKLVQKSIDIFHLNTYSKLIAFLLITIVLVYLVKNIVMLIASYIQISFRNKLKKNLGIRMLASYMNRQYPFFIKTNSSIIIRGVSSDVQGVYTILEMIILSVKEGLTALLIGIYLLVTDFYIAMAIMSFAFICFIFTTLVFKKNLREAGQEQREANSLHSKALYQAVTGIKEIKVSRTEKVFLAQFEDAAEKLRKTSDKNSFISAIPERIIEVGCVCVLMLVIGINIQGGNDSSFVVTLGILAAGSFRLLPSISRLVGYMNMLVFYRPTLQGAYEDIIEVYENPDIRTEKCENEQPIRELREKVEINNVKWKYEEGVTPVLDGLSIRIRKGEAIGIVGKSGAGKTTLMDVFLGLLKPQEGSIELDGINIYSILPQWAKIISYVPQNVFLLDDSIRNNVAFGIDCRQINDKQIWDALEKAQLKEFVEKLPNGLETIVGERGVRFSGGQRQRVAIARALYNNPDILVLDEATSALDNSTESAVMEAINNLKGSITLIIVAHRLSTLRSCDSIYEIKNGKAVKHRKEEIL